MTCKHGNHKTIEECRAFEDGRAEAEKSYTFEDAVNRWSSHFEKAAKFERSRLLAEVREKGDKIEITNPLNLHDIRVFYKISEEALAKLEGGQG